MILKLKKIAYISRPEKHNKWNNKNIIFVYPKYKCENNKQKTAPEIQKKNEMK
jgi:hypothetical protein